MVRADQLCLTALLSRKGNSGEVWRGTLWGKQVRARGAGRSGGGVVGSGGGGQRPWRGASRCPAGAPSQRSAAAAAAHAPLWRRRDGPRGFKRQVAVKLVRIEEVDERLLDCLRREVAVLLHTTGECKQVRRRAEPFPARAALWLHVLAAARPGGELPEAMQVRRP